MVRRGHFFALFKLGQRVEKLVCGLVDFLQGLFFVSVDLTVVFECCHFAGVGKGLYHDLHVFALRRNKLVHVSPSISFSIKLMI